MRLGRPELDVAEHDVAEVEPGQGRTADITTEGAPPPERSEGGGAPEPKTDGGVAVGESNTSEESNDMGYTHYWKRQPRMSRRAMTVATLLTDFIYGHRLVPLAGPYGEGSPIAYEQLVSFNGVAGEGENDHSHETFHLPCDTRAGLLGREPDVDGTVFEFCKTAIKPYDKAVVAVLATVAAIEGKRFKVSSDGTAEDWAEGVALANSILADEEFRKTLEAGNITGVPKKVSVPQFYTDDK